MSEHLIDPESEAFYTDALSLRELVTRHMAHELATMTPERAAADLRSIAGIDAMNEHLTAAHRLEVIARWIEQQAKEHRL